MKMKSLFLLFCVTGVLLSCRQTKKGPDFTFREDVAYILDTIIASNPKGDVYELYINTVDSGNSILLFYMGEKAPLVSFGIRANAIIIASEDIACGC